MALPRGGAVRAAVFDVRTCGFLEGRAAHPLSVLHATAGGEGVGSSDERQRDAVRDSVERGRGQGLRRGGGVGRVGTGNGGGQGGGQEGRADTDSGAALARLRGYIDKKSRRRLNVVDFNKVGAFPMTRARPPAHVSHPKHSGRLTCATRIPCTYVSGSCTTMPPPCVAPTHMW